MFGSKGWCLTTAVAVTGALLGGFINGLLGTGGGIIFTFMYSLLYSGRSADPRDKFVSAMLTVLPISVISLFTYSSPQLRDIRLLLTLIIPSAAGGAVGAFISRHVKASYLDTVFAALIIFAGVRMIF